MYRVHPPQHIVQNESEDTDYRGVLLMRGGSEKNTRMAAHKHTIVMFRDGSVYGSTAACFSTRHLVNLALWRARGTDALPLGTARRRLAELFQGDGLCRRRGSKPAVLFFLRIGCAVSYTEARGCFVAPPRPVPVPPACLFLYVSISGCCCSCCGCCLMVAVMSLLPYDLPSLLALPINDAWFVFV